jgi:hypothetical protein
VFGSVVLHDPKDTLRQQIVKRRAIRFFERIARRRNHTFLTQLDGECEVLLLLLDENCIRARLDGYLHVNHSSHWWLLCLLVRWHWLDFLAVVRLDVCRTKRCRPVDVYGKVPPLYGLYSVRPFPSSLLTPHHNLAL